MVMKFTKRVFVVAIQHFEGPAKFPETRSG